MTVRADIAGKYTNRKYAYEPEDMDFCEYFIILLSLYDVIHSDSSVHLCTFFHSSYFGMQYYSCNCLIVSHQ